MTESYTKIYETILETEETITAEEYLKRRESGSISVEKVEILPPTSGLPWGGFKVRLDKPRYKANLQGKSCHVF